MYIRHLDTLCILFKEFCSPRVCNSFPASSSRVRWSGAAGGWRVAKGSVCSWYISQRVAFLVLCFHCIFIIRLCISKEVRIAGTAKVHLSSLMYFKWVWKALQETTFSYTCSMISTLHFSLSMPRCLAASTPQRRPSPAQPKKELVSGHLTSHAEHCLSCGHTHTHIRIPTSVCVCVCVDVLPLVHIDWLITNYKSCQIGNGLQRESLLQLLLVLVLTFKAINL